MKQCSIHKDTNLLRALLGYELAWSSWGPVDVGGRDGRNWISLTHDMKKCSSAQALLVFLVFRIAYHCIHFLTSFSCIPLTTFIFISFVWPRAFWGTVALGLSRLQVWLTAETRSAWSAWSASLPCIDFPPEGWSPLEPSGARQASLPDSLNGSRRRSNMLNAGVASVDWVSWTAFYTRYTNT